MSRGTNQKLKLYYLGRIMLDKTDDDHALTIQDIKDELWKYGVTADRKSLYLDLQDLEVFGMEILRFKTGRDVYYHVGAKTLEVAEVRVLTDLIQSSPSLSEHISVQLIRKLELFVSRHEAAALNRQIRLRDKGKTTNEAVLYSVDTIHRAMSLNKRICFQYYNTDSEGVIEAAGIPYIDISPWELAFKDTLYYLTGYDSGTRMMNQYFVDRMRDTQLSDQAREGEDVYKKQ